MMTVDSGKRAFAHSETCRFSSLQAFAACLEFAPLYPNSHPHRFFFFLRLFVAFRLEPEPKLGTPPPMSPPIIPPSPPDVIMRIILRISVYSLIIWLTS